MAVGLSAAVETVLRFARRVAAGGRLQLAAQPGMLSPAESRSGREDFIRQQKPARRPGFREFVICAPLPRRQTSTTTGTGKGYAVRIRPGRLTKDELALR